MIIQTESGRITSISRVAPVTQLSQLAAFQAIDAYQMACANGRGTSGIKVPAQAMI